MTGRVRAKIFDPKLKKTQSNPKITHKIAGQPDPTRTRPNLTMSWAGHGPTFFDLKPEVTRPDPTDDPGVWQEGAVLRIEAFRQHGRGVLLRLVGDC